ncbi:MAG: ABC transporter substrate-binding protein, partial [Deltaproteobacteria bacterium]|nr:ABC transporter substrate-binding protein [Deltaproteobacteria bacterium]
VAPFTGPAAEFGTNGWRGIQLALEEINETGITVQGETYKIEIVRYDSRCEPTEAVASLRKLAMEDKVVAILGDHCSSCCMAIGPLCDEFKISGITIECAANGVTSPGHEFYFRMRPSMGLMAPLLTPKIIDLYKPKAMGFLNVNDDYGRSFAQSFKDAMEKEGIKTVVEIYFERGTTDFMAYLSQIRVANPDIVFYVGVTPEGAMILKQARELGVTPQIKFIGAEEMGEMELVKLAGAEAVEGTYSVALWGSVPANFEKRVQDKFKAPMHYAIIFGYDALMVLSDAITRAQSLDPVAIKDALKKTDYAGLEGRIKFETFDNYRNQGRYTPSFIKWEKGKRIPQ